MPFSSAVNQFYTPDLDLNRHLVSHPLSTYFLRMKGTHMQNAGIFDGDILVVDRSLPPSDKKIVVAELNGGLCIRRLRIQNNQTYLTSAITGKPPYLITENDTFSIWGIVTSSVRKL